MQIIEDGLTAEQLEEIGREWDIEVICNIAETRPIRRQAVIVYEKNYTELGAEAALQKAVDLANELNKANSQEW